MQVHGYMAAGFQSTMVELEQEAKCQVMALGGVWVVVWVAVAMPEVQGLCFMIDKMECWQPLP